MHPTAESDSAVCIPPLYTAESVICQVSIFIRNFTINISLSCLKIYYENYTVSRKLIKESFLPQTFFNKTQSESDSAVCIIPQSRAPRCASHREVNGHKFLKKLWGVHHTAESSFTVCIIPWSQAPRCASHRGVRIKNFDVLWLLLKGQSGEILLGVNIMKFKILSIKSDFSF